LESVRQAQEPVPERQEVERYWPHPIYGRLLHSSTTTTFVATAVTVVVAVTVEAAAVVVMGPMPQQLQAELKAELLGHGEA
jgi:hypothetical protein